MNKNGLLHVDFLCIFHFTFTDRNYNICIFLVIGFVRSKSKIWTFCLFFCCQFSLINWPWFGCWNCWLIIISTFSSTNFFEIRIWYNLRIVILNLLLHILFSYFLSIRKRSTRLIVIKVHLIILLRSSLLWCTQFLGLILTILHFSNIFFTNF